MNWSKRRLRSGEAVAIAGEVLGWVLFGMLVVFAMVS